ncbi:DNA polymerase III subunits gamma and tau [Marinomonas sp. MED121]|uniref:DNA polymerase III subunit gamma/tau n=1 Tax=Marinomonas sp. MED121 TaxID=314277 RepID=UPI0000690145|nr:DNA polymerase III subunit gamma/tau [Marinomonas sp. MED121]EAQ63307.1 DNA polymerase III subunits gamma and tau [Marinomonas sp. MED121]
MSYQVLARKWRPQNFIELAGQDHVLQALVNALKQQRLHHAYLFTGTRGVGKTTIARIFAKCLNCETNGISPEPCGTCGSCVEIAEGRFVDLIEVDAASRTKVEDTRELLENVQYTPTRGRFKVYLIDEVHMLSTHSFNALLKTLEEPPAHVKFLLATTDPQKLPVTILSRCLQFNLKNMSPGRVVNYLEKVLTTEQLSYDEAGLWQIGQAANGSMRDALSLTDQAIAFGNGHISETDVTSMLGLVNQAQVVGLLDAIVQSDAANLLKLVNDLADYQPDFVAICASLLDLLHRIAIEQQVPGALEDQLGDLAKVKLIAQQVPSEVIQLFYQTMLIGKRDLPLAHSPKAGFEMLLLRLIAFRPAQATSVSTSPVALVTHTPESTSSASDASEPLIQNEIDSSVQEITAKYPDVKHEIDQAISVATDVEKNLEPLKPLTNEPSTNKPLINKTLKGEGDKATIDQQGEQKDETLNVTAEKHSPVNSASASVSSQTTEMDTKPPFEADEKPKVLDQAAAKEKMADLNKIMQDQGETKPDSAETLASVTETKLAAKELDSLPEQDVEASLNEDDAAAQQRQTPASTGLSQQTQTDQALNNDASEDSGLEVDGSEDGDLEDSDSEDDIELIDDHAMDRSAELVAVMQSQTIEVEEIAPITETEALVEKAIATNLEDVSYTKAQIIVQPALGEKVEPIDHFSKMTMQMWWLIAPRLPLTGLVQNILMNSCMLEAGEQGIKLEVPLEYGHMLNQVRYEQIQGAISHYFDAVVPLIINTVEDVSGVTAEEFAASKRAQAMQEAIEHLNAHPIVQALSSTMGGQLIYDSVKIKA